jgi:hypothetical protein
VSRAGGIALLALVPVVILALVWLFATPRHERRWAPEQSVLPRAVFEGSRVRIEGVRNFRWTSDRDSEPAWEDREYDLDRVATAWYVLVPLTRKWRGPAHALVTFGFDDGQYLAISVEARREVKESYGVLKGLLRRFELIYVIGDERDLIGRRAVFDGVDVFLYPIRADRASIGAVLRAMLERANSIRERPEFYNSVTNNCTLNLVRHVNQLVPGRIPGSWRIVLPGYSDEVIHRLGLIDSAGSIAEARVRFRINDRARAALNDSAFSRRIRE